MLTDKLRSQINIKAAETAKSVLALLDVQDKKTASVVWKQFMDDGRSLSSLVEQAWGNGGKKQKGAV